MISFGLEKHVSEEACRHSSQEVHLIRNTFLSVLGSGVKLVAGVTEAHWVLFKICQKGERHEHSILNDVVRVEFQDRYLRTRMPRFASHSRTLSLLGNGASGVSPTVTPNFQSGGQMAI